MKEKTDGLRYKYENVVCLRIIDGDSAVFLVDVGFHTQMKHTFRLSRINAWEVRGKEREKGLKAKEFVKKMMEGKRVWLETKKAEQQGKFGRYLAEVYVDGRNLNDMIVENGHGKYQDY